MFFLGGRGVNHFYQMTGGKREPRVGRGSSAWGKWKCVWRHSKVAFQAPASWASDAPRRLTQGCLASLPPAWK